MLSFQHSASIRPGFRPRHGRSFFTMLLPLLAVAAIFPSGCKFAREYLPAGAYSSSDATDCLPNITLHDQADKPVALSSFKGKPVLIDFIYTSCPGPCLVLTARMRKIARDLGPQVGSDITLISVTVDPEHDGPKQLAYYAKQQGAVFPGWYFL
ncbi:MAG: SCO family protein, partial [Candidatus Binataceae bacterium]